MGKHRIFIVLLFFILLAVLALAGPAWSQTPGPAQPKQPAASKADQQQAQAWADFYAGKYADAFKLAQQLDKSPIEAARLEALHCQARCLWAQSQAVAATNAEQAKALAAQAQQLWKSSEKATRNSHIERLKIAKALGLEAQKMDDAAAEMFSQVLRRNLADTCTAEAAIELARLHVKAKKFDDAKKMLQTAVSFLDQQTKSEMSVASADPFKQAAKKAIDHLKYDMDAGREPFENAERLRHAGKFAQAVKAYQAIIKDFPEADYAPRSQLCIGYCLCGIKQPAQALEHWKKFIAAAPAGPWRAQAYLRLTDWALEDSLDLGEAAKQMELARASLPTALADEKAKSSWYAAQFDIHLRVGMVSFCQGKGPQAAEAFEAAQKLTTSKPLIESLDALIAAAKTGKAVIPQDCAGAASTQSAIRNPQSAISLALSLGTIHLIAGRYDNANAFFTRVCGAAGPAMPGATPAQLAFAIFGQGAVLQAKNKPQEAKDQFLASIKAFPDGSWHDETLYRTATIIQNQAEAKYGKVSEPSASGKDAKSGQPAEPPAVSKAEPPTPQQREAQDKAETERLANLLKVKAQALPYWQELTRRYSNKRPDGSFTSSSPRVEPAMYYVGVLLCETAEATDQAKAQEAWKQALDALKAFTASYPRSPYAGDAYVRQLGALLERLFDLKTAQAQAPLALGWAQATNQLKPSTVIVLAPWALAPHVQDAAVAAYKAYECQLAAGLVAYLAQDYDNAKIYLEAAGKSIQNDDAQFRNRPEGLFALGLKILLMAVESKQSVTDAIALQERMTDRQKVAIQIADLYLKAARPDKSEIIYHRLLAGEVDALQVGLRAYATIKLAESLNHQRFRQKEALEVLDVFRGKQYAGTYFGGYGLFRLAVTTFNQTQDREKSLELYDEMIRRYPEHPMTELAYAYFCLNAFRAGHREEAEKAFAAFKAKYPQSKWISNISEQSAKPSAPSKPSKELQKGKGQA